MLPKKERLTRSDFNRFFAMGKRYNAAHFQVVFAPYPTLHASVVVSKKVAKTAVLRNKIRRRLYAIVRHSRDEQGLTGVYILITKAGVAQCSYKALQDEFMQLHTHMVTRN